MVFGLTSVKEIRTLLWYHWDRNYHWFSFTKWNLEEIPKKSRSYYEIEPFNFCISISFEIDRFNSLVRVIGPGFLSHAKSCSFLLMISLKFFIWFMFSYFYLRLYDWEGVEDILHKEEYSLSSITKLGCLWGPYYLLDGESNLVTKPVYFFQADHQTLSTR